MSNFNNDKYRLLIEELINDTFYTEGVSYSNKIASIRRYTEIILRKMLDYPSGKKLTLGNINVQNRLAKKGYTEPLFLDSLDCINHNGSNRTHSQITEPATEEEYNRTLEALFNIYGYLFYKYFKEYPYGSNDKIVTAFSLLPPVIRHITLTELYNDDPSDQFLIYKLILAKAKTYDKKTTFNWIEDKKDHLKEIAGFGCETMYDECVNQANLIYKGISEFGSLYKTFEEAVDKYKEFGIVSGETEEIREFNSLMEFVYIGRKDEKDKIEHPYILFILNE